MTAATALVMMLMVSSLGCGAELDFIRCKAFTGAMKTVAEALECYTQESLQIHKENRNSLQLLQVTMSAVINENQGLREQLQAKDQKVAQLTEANGVLTTKLADNGKQVKNLEERLSASLQQVSIHTENEKRHNIMVQDLNNRLQEYERRVQELEETVQKLNQTMAAKKKEQEPDLECRQPQLQKIKNVVQRFKSSNDMSQLREELESALDSCDEEYRQLRSIKRDGMLSYRLGNEGHTQLVCLLLCAGFPVDTADSDGYNMLHGAARGGHVKLVKLLLQHGAQLDARTTWQQTPLILAASNGHLEAVKVLVEAGASTTARDNEGSTALEAARYYSQADVLQYLQQLTH